MNELFKIIGLIFLGVSLIIFFMNLSIEKGINGKFMKIEDCKYIPQVEDSCFEFNSVEVYFDKELYIESPIEDNKIRITSFPIIINGTWHNVILYPKSEEVCLNFDKNNLEDGKINQRYIKEGKQE